MRVSGSRRWLGLPSEASMCRATTSSLGLGGPPLPRFFIFSRYNSMGSAGNSESAGTSKPELVRNSRVNSSHETTWNVRP